MILKSVTDGMVSCTKAKLSSVALVLCGQQAKQKEERRGIRKEEELQASAGMAGHGSILSGEISGLHADQYGPMWHSLTMNTFNYFVALSMRMNLFFSYLQIKMNQPKVI